MDVGTVDFWIMVGVAILCGGTIGLERQLRGKPSGVRTSILVCLGTTMFIALSLAYSDVAYADRTRVLGQVVTGIGFLGAGVILIREGVVLGITSAAVIWLLASVGCLIGFHEYYEAIALSFITIAILVGVGLAEGKYVILKRGIYSPEKNIASVEIVENHSRLQDFIDLAQQGEKVRVKVKLTRLTSRRDLHDEESKETEQVAGSYFLRATYEIHILGNIYNVSKVYANGELNESQEDTSANIKIANARLELDYERLRAAGIAVEETHFQ